MIAANDETLGLARARLALKILFLLTALLLIAAGAFVVASDAWAIARSKKAIHDFRKDHPCPATGKAKGACPGLRDRPRQAALRWWPRSPIKHGMAGHPVLE